MKDKKTKHQLVWERAHRQTTKVSRKLKTLATKYRKRLKYWMPFIQVLSSTVVIAKALGLF